MSGTNKYPAQYFTQLLDCPSTLIPNDILQVNSTGTSIIEVTPGSVIPPVIGTGTVNDIPIFTGSVPIFGDSGVEITASGSDRTIQNAGGNFTITSGGGHTTLSDTYAEVNSGHSVALGSGDLISISAAGSITLNEATDNHTILMDNTGITITTGSGLPLSLNINGATGTANQVLTAAGDGSCNWQNGGSSSIPSVIAQIPTWQVGSLTAFVSNQPPISPWYSSASVDPNIVTGWYGQGQWFVFPNTSDPSFNLGYDFGSQNAGNYQLIFNYKSYSSCAIITVTELNTSLNIGSIDAFIPNTSGDNTFGQCILCFNWASTGDIKINFSVSTKNPSSSGYDFALIDNLTLIQLS